MNLRQRLNRERRLHGHISIAALKRLVTEEAVRNCLRSKHITIERSVPSFVASAAPKLFAILILLALEYYIRDFVNSGCSDGIFPILETDIPPFLEGSNRRTFFLTQWVIPLKFQVGRHLKLPGKAILPFIWKDLSSSGGFGVIYKVKVAEGHLDDIPPNHTLALKTVRKDEHDGWDTIMREVETLRHRRHPNIVPLLASYTICGSESDCEAEYLNMLFPYAQMDMEHWLNLKLPPIWLAEKSLSDRQEHLYYALYGLISGLAFLHREIDGLTTSHHDLKPQNILVVDGNLLLADLGRSHLISLDRGSETEGKSGLGTFRYHPPEYWNEDGTRAVRSHGRGFDVWAMGCIMIEVAIVIAYGWESESVCKFRQERLRLSHDQRRFERRQGHGCDDDSFHNSMVVVRRWVSQLQEDGNTMLKKTLAIVVEMLQTSPKERLLSWEAELDFYDLLHPDAICTERLEVYAARVQEPSKVVNGVSTPLHRASIRGNVDRVTILLQAGWPPDSKDGMGDSPLQLAERNGHYTVKQTLSRQAANSNTRPSMSPQIKQLTDVLTATNRASEDSSNSRNTCNRGRPEFKGSPVSREVVTCKKQAAGQDLLRNVSNVNARDKYGDTMLHQAARRGDKALVKLALEYGADINARDDDDNTALHITARRGNDATLQLLLDHGADIHIRDEEGRTALHIASQYEKQSLARRLLEYEADTNAT